MRNRTWDDETAVEYKLLSISLSHTLLRLGFNYVSDLHRLRNLGADCTRKLPGALQLVTEK